MLLKVFLYRPQVIEKNATGVNIKRYVLYLMLQQNELECWQGFKDSVIFPSAPNSALP
jgi:hypothetical protein